MNDHPSDLSALTGPELVRAFLADKPRPTPEQRTEFFELGPRVSAAIAERESRPDADRFATCVGADAESTRADSAANEPSERL